MGLFFPFAGEPGIGFLGVFLRCAMFFFDISTSRVTSPATKQEDQIIGEQSKEPE